MFASFYSCTESFIGSIADFQVLTVAEKSSLYQRNLHGVLNICATFLLRMASMFESPANNHLIVSVYGQDIFERTKRIGLQLDDDLVLIKLMMVTFAFSSNCYMVELKEENLNDRLLLGTFRLWGSQNVYAELLWSYLTYRYNYYEAALRFARMIKNLLDLLKMSGDVHHQNDLHQQFVEEVTVLTEQTLTINENELVPVWGKTWMPRLKIRNLSISTRKPNLWNQKLESRIIPIQLSVFILSNKTWNTVKSF